MRNDFPHPLTADVPAHFCHPTFPCLTTPFHHQGTVYAGNSYIACAFHRGLWLPTDFPDPEDSILHRFLQLPWSTFDNLRDDATWHPLHDVRPALFKSGPADLWKDNRPAPSPVVLVAEKYLIRLSHLQLIACLPRAEILGTGGGEDTLAFRFSGGTGLIPRDPRIAGPPRTSPFTRPHSFLIFNRPQPHFDGVELPSRSTVSPKVRDALIEHNRREWNAKRAATGWPPPEPKDD